MDDADERRLAAQYEKFRQLVARDPDAITIARLDDVDHDGHRSLRGLDLGKLRTQPSYEERLLTEYEKLRQLAEQLVARDPDAATPAGFYISLANAASPGIRRARASEKVRRGAESGGYQRRAKHKVSPEILCAEVEALHEGRRSWSAACAKVAKRHAMSARHVRRLTEPVRWPRP